MTTVLEINEEYFGEDKSKTYLKDDFTKVLLAAIQRDVILYVIKEASKARHDKEKYKDGGVAYGDFDPYNAGLLFNIFENYEKGFMIDVRQLLIEKEAGAGGKFIKDIQGLTTDNFIDFYKNSVSIPPLLLANLNNHSEDKPIDVVKFIDSNRTKIDKKVNGLITKAQQFQSKGYFKSIVFDYQALEFHKDNRPTKYNVRKETTDFPFADGEKTIRSRISEVDIKTIAECLNDFAEIITLYQELVVKNTSFFSPNWSLKAYVERTFALFNKEIPASVKKQAIKSIATHLHKSLDIVDWNRKTN